MAAGLGLLGLETNLGLVRQLTPALDFQHQSFHLQFVHFRRFSHLCRGAKRNEDWFARSIMAGNEAQGGRVPEPEAPAIVGTGTTIHLDLRDLLLATTRFISKSSIRRANSKSRWCIRPSIGQVSAFSDSLAESPWAASTEISKTGRRQVIRLINYTKRSHTRVSAKVKAREFQNNFEHLFGCHSKQQTRREARKRPNQFKKRKHQEKFVL